MQNLPATHVLSSLSLAYLASLASCSLSGPTHWVEDAGSFEIDVEGLRGTTTAVHDGSVVVMGRQGQERIQVEYERHGGGSDETDAQRALDSIRLTTDTAPDGTLKLGWVWDPGRDRTWGAKVHYRVTQPSSFAASASAHNGTVRIEGCQANVKARTHNGSVRVLDCVGRARLNAHNGSLKLSGTVSDVAITTHNGSIHATLQGADEVKGNLQTHNGGITVVLGEQTPVHVEASTHNGAIRAKRKFAKLETHRRRLSASTGDTQGQLRLQTYNGAIRIE